MKKLLITLTTVCTLALAAAAHAQTPAPGAPPAAAAAPAPAAMAMPDMTAQLKAISTPKAEDKAAGDPAGTITGTVADIPVGDAKKGPDA